MLEGATKNCTTRRRKAFVRSVPSTKVEKEKKFEKQTKRKDEKTVHIKIVFGKVFTSNGQQTGVYTLDRKACPTPSISSSDKYETGGNENSES